jgi:hypothetical protein
VCGMDLMPVESVWCAACVQEDVMSVWCAGCVQEDLMHVESVWCAACVQEDVMHGDIIANEGDAAAFRLELRLARWSAHNIVTTPGQPITLTLHIAIR